MSWLKHHRLSEELASNAEVAARRGEHTRAKQLYVKAAQSEELALKDVEPAKSRTYGITAVSAVALHYKAAQWKQARNLANRCLNSGRLPDFATRQIEELLNSMKEKQAAIDRKRPNT